jgi:signal transduction histidine kinase
LLGLIAGVLLLGKSAQPDADPRADVLRRQVNAARDSEEAATQAFGEAVSPLGFPLGSNELPSAAGLDNLEVALESTDRTRKAWDEANEKLAEATRKRRAQEQRVDHAREERDRIGRSHEAAWLEWQGWLQEHNLPPGALRQTP